MHNTVRKQLFTVGNAKPLLGAPSGIKPATDPTKMLPHPEDASTAASSDSNGSSTAEQQRQPEMQLKGSSPAITLRL